ncbi:MAG: hypothetical protein GXO64_01720 [Candidatus Micrarchaeota archaeon]|nr:hypothetical protein [Candidatus Micrarchaeota archaeon]
MTDNETYEYDIRRALLIPDNNSGIVEFFCANESGPIEIYNGSVLMHRYDPQFFEMTEGPVFLRFPVASSEELKIRALCNGSSYEENFTVSENETVRLGNLFDMQIEFNMEDKLLPYIEHENIFMIRNNDHKTGRREDISVFVDFYMRNMQTNKTTYFNFTKGGINSYTASGTGKLKLDEGAYEICGIIKNISAAGEIAIDPVPENDNVCKIAETFLEKDSSSCFQSINITANATCIGKNANVFLKITNFTGGSIINISWQNMFTHKVENDYIFPENESFAYSLKLPDYGIYQIAAELLPLCEDSNLSDNEAYATIGLIEENDFGIEAYAENRTYTEGDTLVIPVYAYNGLESNASLTIRILLKRKTKSGWKDVAVMEEKKQSLAPLSFAHFNATFNITNETISGYYKIHAKATLNKSRRYSYSYFSVDALEDMGEENITVIRSPSEIRFGEIRSITVDFYSGNRKADDAIFVAYINKYHGNGKTKYPSVDFDLSALRSRVYDAKTAMHLQIERGRHYYLSLPLFITPNCDGRYESGSYRGVVRAYLEEDKGRYISESFQTFIRNGDGIFCADEKKCSYHSSSRKTVITDDRAVDQKDIKYPSVVFAGDEFEVLVNTRNEDEKTANVSVYSYVFDAGKLHSFGFSNGTWKGGWTANRKDFTLSPNSGKIVTLKNMIKDDTVPGTYSLRIREVINGKKTDRTFSITVKGHEAKKSRTEQKNCSLDVVWNEKNESIVIAGSSDCSGCSVLITTPEGLREDAVPFIFETKAEGLYSFVLISNESVVLNSTVANITSRRKFNIMANKTLPVINLKEKKEYNAMPTGMAAGKTHETGWIGNIIQFLLSLIGMGP